MDIKFYNSLSGEKEIFKPLKKTEVGIYTCGPTVYDRAHIGNLRAYIFADTLRRTLEFNDYKVNHVINITDVGHLSSDADSGEDKMVKALKRENLPMTMESMKELGQVYKNKFVDDLRYLNIKLPNSFPVASNHIKENIDLIKGLEKKKYTYTTSDGIYFDTSKFPEYGKLGQLKESIADDDVSRINSNSEKKNFRDFALWKFNKKLGWESPWGRGFPGWHIECSAMSEKYLGKSFDIHTGGIDHKTIHHNNEIAQSEALNEKPLANFWMHNEFANVNDEKMAKSLGNYTTLQDVIDQGFNPLTVRYLYLGAHYRSPINLSNDTLQNAENSLSSLVKSFARLGNDGGKPAGPYLVEANNRINDDLNTSEVLALVWSVLRDTRIKNATKRATILKIDEVLGLDIERLASQIESNEVLDIPSQIQAMLDERKNARNSGDFAKSDKIRSDIEQLGYVIEDTPEGTKLLKK